MVLVFINEKENYLTFAFDVTNLNGELILAHPSYQDNKIPIIQSDQNLLMIDVHIIMLR